MWRMQKTILMITVVVLAGCASTPAKTTPATATEKKPLIADPILEKEIREILKKPPGELTKADLEKVTKLIITGKGLTDVSALAEHKQLTYLNLGDNKVADINALAGLNQLTYLNLDINKLTDVSALAGLTKLENLGLHNNNLEDVTALMGLTKLKTLRLYSNPNLTKAQIAELQKALPNCEIEHNAKK